MTAALEAALAYTAAGWVVFPCKWQGVDRKAPLTRRGLLDASGADALIRAWWGRWPAALIGTPTGRGSVVLDVDPRHGGLETLAALGFAELPVTLTARTGGGGFHLYFVEPEAEIRNTQGGRGRGIGAGLDWRGGGGYVILPSPGSGYAWVDAAASMAEVPPALLPRQNTMQALPAGAAAECVELSAYGEAALGSAAGKILAAPNGEQEAMLNGEAFSIGSLVGAGWVPSDVALEVLLLAAAEIKSFDPARPWRPGQAEAKVRRAFAQGRAKPRPEWSEVERAFDRLMAEAGNVE